MDLSAAFGILGTLAGVVVGALGSWKIQERQLEHENRSRFHDLRLDTYAMFSSAVNSIRATARVAGTHDSAAAGQLLAAFNKILIVASSDVSKHAGVAHKLAFEVLNAADKKAKANELDLELTKSVAAFNLAARKELGID